LTDAELSKYFWLAKEIEIIEHELNTKYIEDSSSDLRKQSLIKKKKKAALELLAIEDFLDNLDDPEMRIILRLRYCLRMTWEAIGDEIFMSASGVLRKCRRFFKNNVS